MLTIVEATESDRRVIQKLIAEYHASEGIIPIKERIAWAVDERLKSRTPGLLLVARDMDRTVGVALAECTPSAELGLVMTVNDFFVVPESRGRGVGRELAKHLIDRCRTMKIDEINLEVLSNNKAAAAFWNSMGFRPADRFLFKQKLSNQREG